MGTPQCYPTCDERLKKYIDNFVSLLKFHLGDNLKGVYLHGSLAMNSFYYPKSDIDILAVVYDDIPSQKAKELNIAIAHYNEKRPIYGSLEFSLINSRVAKTVPKKIPYILHYSSMWHERILNDEVSYSDNMIDTDLSAHLTVVKNRGICLYGTSIDETFGEVNWEHFIFAVIDDLMWILEDENIFESPYYAILNICRVMQMLTDKDNRCLSKNEGGFWGLANLPTEYKPLIQKALNTYRSDYFPKDETDRKTGGVSWNKNDLKQFRDFAKARYEELRT